MSENRLLNRPKITPRVTSYPFEFCRNDRKATVCPPPCKFPLRFEEFSCAEIAMRVNETIILLVRGLDRSLKTKILRRSMFFASSCLASPLFFPVPYPVFPFRQLLASSLPDPLSSLTDRPRSKVENRESERASEFREIRLERGEEKRENCFAPTKESSRVIKSVNEF